MARPDDTSMPVPPDGWSTPPLMPRLQANQVHVWCVPLGLADDQLPMLSRLLSADEHQRAERFHFEKDRRQFVAARGLLRVILGRYLAIAPEIIQFCYNAYGKPALKPTQHAQGKVQKLEFNLSHSHEFALYGVTQGHPIGIDVEYMRSEVNWVALAESVFSTQERAILHALPTDQQIPAFFRGWTCKEAYIKAEGQGLSRPLETFDVALGPEESAALVRSQSDPDAVNRWVLQTLAVDAAYAAALAVACPQPQFSYWYGLP